MAELGLKPNLLTLVEGSDSFDELSVILSYLKIKF